MRTPASHPTRYKRVALRQVIMWLSPYQLCLTLLLAFPPAAIAADDHVGTPVKVPTGPIVVQIASVMGGVEWAIDVPWRIEPPYDKLPITVAFHDVAAPKDDTNVPGYQRFCDLVVVTGRPEGTRSVPLSSTRIGLSSFHEVERSAKWPASSDGPAFHTLRRHWRGEPITAEDARLTDTAEWYGTALLDVSALAPGDYILTVVAIVSPWADHCPAWQPRVPNLAELFGLQGSFHDHETGALWHANTVRVHLAQQPLPRFGPGWVYGDLHYHSQGTDNEGESALSYRAVIQVMKAMGLDFLVAADHASSSDQVTDIDEIFVDNLPNIPYLPGWIEDMILDYVSGASVPIETSIDAARDMNLRRWRYLHGWLNSPNGVNRQVLSSGGSLRAPQIFLGGEVDTIPEISAQDRANGYFTYSNNTHYYWAHACLEIPSIFLDLIDYTTFEVCPTTDVLVEEASEGGRYLLRDIQGMASPAFFARQHFVHLPADPTRDDAFVASQTTRYGGGHRRLQDILREDYEEGEKGYFFLAHPVAAASGRGFSRLGPDLVPYSDVQLMTAFQSPYFLGLQLWNEDTRLRTTLAGDASVCPVDGNFLPRADGFPMAALQDCDLYHPDFTFPDIWPRFINWGRQDEDGQLRALHHGAVMWDKMLLWGMNPTKTAALPWLPPGTPRRVFMAGGSDGHGDLNYRREGAITGWTSTTDTALGKPRNLVFVGTERPQAVDGGTTIGQTQVVEALQTGHFTVTDGPALRITIDRSGNALPKGQSVVAKGRVVRETVNAIGTADVPMGGVAQTRTPSVPVLVEWKSTPEFGPVTSIDIYVGVQAGTLDGAVWAPLGHGPDTSAGTVATDIPDWSGNVFTQLTDGYFLDPSGKLRITVPPAEGMGGVRKIVLNGTDYPIVEKECHTETEVIPPICQQFPGGPGGLVTHCTKPQIIEHTVCQATSVTAAERFYVRAFARTSTTASVGIGVVPLERYAYTNPIWIRPSLFPYDGTDLPADVP